jgi:two-component SAPR family response regulator
LTSLQTIPIPLQQDCLSSRKHEYIVAFDDIEINISSVDETGVTNEPNDNIDNAKKMIDLLLGRLFHDDDEPCSMLNIIAYSLFG